MAVPHARVSVCMQLLSTLSQACEQGKVSAYPACECPGTGVCVQYVSTAPLPALSISSSTNDAQADMTAEAHIGR